jgi:hypothetical protein
MKKNIRVCCNTFYKNELDYICDVIFKVFCGIDYVLVNDETNKKETIQLEFEGSKIALANVLFNTDPAVWLTRKSHPAVPLRERELLDFNGNTFLFQSVPVLFGLPVKCEIGDADGIFDIDIFGSIFFMLTRYEEVGSEDSDLDYVGRYDERKTLAFKSGFYHRALVNEYLEILLHLIQARSTNSITRKNRKYKLMVSHDIDFPLSVANRTAVGFLKNVVGDVYVRRSLRLAFDRVVAKIQSMRKKPFKDPYSTFDYLMECAEKFSYHCTFNFIPGNAPHSMDGVRSVDYALDTPYFHEVLKSINQRGHYIGFHPSYITFCNSENTSAEFDNLVSIMQSCNIRQEGIGGRQHFLRWRNPQTWQIWNDLGLDYDSSLGFPGLCGFRTGTCYEYPTYNLMERKKLALQEIPLMVMDTAVLDLSSSQFSEKFILDVFKICKAYNGVFTLLYHNNNVVSKMQRVKYEKILQAVSR